MSLPKLITDKIKNLRSNEVAAREDTEVKQTAADNQREIEEGRKRVISDIKRVPGQSAAFQSIERRHVSQLYAERYHEMMPHLG